MSKVPAIAQRVSEILELLGVDLSDPSTRDTPNRVAKMFVHEIFRGLSDEPPAIMTQPNHGYDQMLVEVNVKINSTCEHHLVPIIGVAHIAYIPKDKLLGLSKFNRIVDYWARRPQVQERLTEQILKHLIDVLETDHVAVVIDAAHMCVRLRGIQDQTTITRTTALSGAFRNGAEARQEFMGAIPSPSDLRVP